MMDQLGEVAFVKTLESFPFGNPIHHVWENDLLFCGVYNGIPSDQHLQGIQQRRRYCSGEQGVDYHPGGRGAHHVPDHLEALESYCSLECLAHKVQPGRLVEPEEAFPLLDVPEAAENGLVDELGAIGLNNGCCTWTRVLTVSTGR